ncbi:NUDIX hydrolase [Solimonas variicoloris]|uniref:NUDIX hydrolase n=1 Tax=Solimonas variicoloris TaxID=254408 RepID=UPI000371E0FD|nr:NUDIX hydrolase [Solimonas variicoloris]
MYAETRYCNACGHEIEFRVPDGDHLPRHVCPNCGHIQYRNPKVIVGVIPENADGRVLMCRRNIEPRLGLWTFPAGFMELGETSGQGAAREAMEEAQADVEIDDLLMVINVPYVSQVYMIHRGTLRTEHYGPTFESSEVRLMREDEIPWDDIAFPTIWHSLKQFFADRRAGAYATHSLDLAYRPKPPQRAEVAGDDPLTP